MKKLLILSLLGVSLTGCIVAPYDDYPDNGRYDRHDKGRYDRDRDHRKWDERKRPGYNDNRPNRPNWNNDRPRPDPRR